MALIKKDKSDTDLKKVCQDQLEVFLASNTQTFVDKLFQSLQDKSYNNKSSSSETTSSKTDETPIISSSVNSHSVDNESSSSRRRRSRSKSPGRRPSNKTSNSMTRGGRRHLDRSVVKRTEEVKSSTNKYSTRGRDRRSGSRSRSPSPSRVTRKRIHSSRSRSRSPFEKDAPNKRDVSRKRSASRSPERDVKRRDRCRDFDEKGVCLRGDLCPFDHGSDPVVLDAATGPIFGLNAPSGSGMMSNEGPRLPVPPPASNNSIGWQEYDPGNPSMDIRPSNIMMPPLNGPPAPSQGPPSSGHWNHSSGHTGHFPRPPLMSHLPPTHSAPSGRPNLSTIIPDGGDSAAGVEGNSHHQGQLNRNNNNVNNNNNNYNAFHQPGNHNNPHSMGPGDRGGNSSAPGRGSSRGRGFRGRGRGYRGSASGGMSRSNDQPEKCTLEVRRLPSNLNNISSLNEYFSKFGTIVNLQVRFQGDPEAAVIQFSSQAEASAAHRCPEAVLGNRFIKLFWHNKEQDPEKTDASTSNSTENSSSNYEDGDAKKSSEEDTRLSVKDRLDFKPEGESAKASRPVLNPNLLRKSNLVDKTEAPVIKTRSEHQKDKLFKNIEIRKKTENILSSLRKDQTSIGEKLINAKSKEERAKLKQLFDVLDVKRKEVEEELKKINEELLTECSRETSPVKSSRGRRGHHLPRGGSHVVHPVKIQERKKSLDQELDQYQKPSLEGDEQQDQATTEEQPESQQQESTDIVVGEASIQEAVKE